MYKIEKIDPTTINWGNTHAKYMEIEKKVGELKIGEAVKISKIDHPGAPAYIAAKVYKKIKGNYRLRTRYNKENQAGFFWKTDR